MIHQNILSTVMLKNDKTFQWKCQICEEKRYIYQNINDAVYGAKT